MKTQHIITLPNGRRITAGAYVTAWRKLLTMAPDTAVRGWNWHANSAAEVLSAMRHGLHDRINRHDRTRLATWRKLDPDWQRSMSQAACMLNTPRLIIHSLPTELRQRFAHRLEGIT